MVEARLGGGRADSGRRVGRGRQHNLQFMEIDAAGAAGLRTNTDIGQAGIPRSTSAPRPDRNPSLSSITGFAEEIPKNPMSAESTLASGLENGAPSPINFDASHHLGGAVMGKNPKTSVVDATLRVHSVPNCLRLRRRGVPHQRLCQPHYAMCALAIRLADTLKEKLGVKNLPPETRANQKQKSTQKTEPQKIIVIGAGKRAQDDVIPALEATGKFEISGIYAQAPRSIYLGPR